MVGGEGDESISDDEEMIVPKLKQSTLRSYGDALTNHSSHS